MVEGYAVTHLRGGTPIDTRDRIEGEVLIAILWRTDEALDEVTRAQAPLLDLVRREVDIVRRREVVVVRRAEEAVAVGQDLQYAGALEDTREVELLLGASDGLHSGLSLRLGRLLCLHLYLMYLGLSRSLGLLLTHLGLGLRRIEGRQDLVEDGLTILVTEDHACGALRRSCCGSFAFLSGCDCGGSFSDAGLYGSSRLRSGGRRAGATDGLGSRSYRLLDSDRLRILSMLFGGLGYSREGLLTCQSFGLRWATTLTLRLLYFGSILRGFGGVISGSRRGSGSGLGRFMGRLFGRRGLARATRLTLDTRRLSDGDSLLVQDLVDQFALLGEGIGREAYFSGDLLELLQRLAGQLGDIVSLHIDYEYVLSPGGGGSFRTDVIGRLIDTRTWGSRLRER